MSRIMCVYIHLEIHVAVQPAQSANKISDSVYYDYHNCLTFPHLATSCTGTTPIVVFQLNHQSRWRKYTGDITLGGTVQQLLYNGGHVLCTGLQM